MTKPKRRGVAKPEDLWRVLCRFLPHQVTCNVERAKECIDWCALRLTFARPLSGGDMFARGPSPFTIELTYADDYSSMSYGLYTVGRGVNGYVVYFYFPREDCPPNVGEGWHATIRCLHQRRVLSFPVGVFH